MQNVTTAIQQNKIALFEMTQPDLLDGLVTTERENKDGKVTGLRLSPMKRKDVADGLGLTANKENASKIDAELLKLKDAVKTVGIGEMVKLASSPGWTGGTFNVSVAKNGKRKASLSLESVQRDGGSLTPEQLIKALAGMTDEEKLDILSKSEEARKAMAPAIEQVKELEKA